MHLTQKAFSEVNKVVFNHIKVGLILLISLLFLVACGPPPGPAGGPPRAGGGGTDSNAPTLNTNTEGDYLIIESNGIPDHAVGTFPTTADLNNDGRPDNPNEIQSQSYRFKIPLNPQMASSPTELRMGPIGVSVNGIPFYNAFTAERTYAIETEVFDQCQGHPDEFGRYHYHQQSSCITENMLGYAFDGFIVYGPSEEDGQKATGLDDCNGHQHDGSYHYHATGDVSKPIIGCYSGVVESSNFRQ